jgi:hypothetical protein
VSLLKKIGTISVNILGIITGVGPLIVPNHTAALDRVADVFQEVIGAIATIEQIGAALGMAGADKLKSAIPLMGQIFGRSVLVRTHGIKDPVLYEKAMVGYAQATVDLLNSLDSKQVKSEDLAA